MTKWINGIDTKATGKANKNKQSLIYNEIEEIIELEQIVLSNKICLSQRNEKDERNDSNQIVKCQSTVRVL